MRCRTKRSTMSRHSIDECRRTSTRVFFPGHSMDGVLSCLSCVSFVDKRSVGNAQLQGLGSDFRLGHHLKSAPLSSTSTTTLSISRAIGSLNTMAPNIPYDPWVANGLESRNVPRLPTAVAALSLHCASCVLARSACLESCLPFNSRYGLLFQPGTFHYAGPLSGAFGGPRVIAVAKIKFHEYDRWS